jgi:hypothetical protein
VLSYLKAERTLHTYPVFILQVLDNTFEMERSNYEPHILCLCDRDYIHHLSQFLTLSFQRVGIFNKIHEECVLHLLLLHTNLYELNHHWFFNRSLRVCHVVSVTDLYSRILGFLDRRRYFFFQVAPQLYSRG